MEDLSARLRTRASADSLIFNACRVEIRYVVTVH